MPMSTAVASSLSGFTKRSELAKSPSAAESSNESLHPARPNLMTRMRGWRDKLVASAFVRYMLAIFIGIAATLAWQSYSGAARMTIAGWSQHLAWLAPAAVPHGISPERIKATSFALAAVHQSVDKLEAEISKLEAQGSSDRTATSPPSRRGSRRP
jgi:hypothetical protein